MTLRRARRRTARLSQQRHAVSEFDTDDGAAAAADGAEAPTVGAEDRTAPASNRPRRPLAPLERDRLARAALGLPPRPADARDPSDPWGRRRRQNYRGNLRVRVISKVLSYGAFFLLFKLYRSKYPPNADKTTQQLGKEGGDGWAPKNRRRRRKKPPLFVKLRRILGIESDSDSVSDATAAPSKLPVDVRQFQAGPDAADVFVVPNFVEIETAKRWRDALSYEWKRQFSQPQQAEGGDELSASYPPNESGGAWTFATAPLPDDDASQQNSIESRESRNFTAHAARKNGISPSFARWDLDPGHPLRREIERTFLGADVLGRVHHMVGLSGHPQAEGNGGASKEVGLDLTVGHYGPGDFVLLGSGNNSPPSADSSWRVILSLWSPPQRQTPGGKGGSIRFQCQLGEGLCESMRLESNNAVLLPGASVLHEMGPVAWEEWLGGARHFAVIGEYRFQKKAAAPQEEL